MLEHAASESAELGAKQAREARGWYIGMTTDIFGSKNSPDPQERRRGSCVGTAFDLRGCEARQSGLFPICWHAIFIGGPDVRDCI